MTRRLYLARADLVPGLLDEIETGPDEGRSAVVVCCGSPRGAAEQQPKPGPVPVIDLRLSGSWPIQVLDVVAAVRALPPSDVQVHLSRRASGAPERGWERTLGRVLSRRRAGGVAPGTGPGSTGPTDGVDEIRLLSADDLPLLAHVHMAAFPDSVVTKLGFRAAMEAHRAMMRDPDTSVVLGAFQGERLTGLFVGQPAPNHLTSFLVGNALSLGGRSVLRIGLILGSDGRSRAKVVGQMVRSRLGRSSGEPAGGAAATPPVRSSFKFLSLAVDPRDQGRRIGIRLMAAAEEEAVSRHYVRGRLSVARHNTWVQEFHGLHGWEIVETYDTSVKMEKDFVAAAEPAAAGASTTARS